MSTREDANYTDAIKYLYSRLNYERTDSIAFDKDDFRLDRMRQLLAELGDPHRKVPTIHVAGTKGKGSTSHFLASSLTQAGFRTGCYTSPHLVHIEERFAINGTACRPDRFVELVDELRPAIEKLDRLAPDGAGPTFFEITTAIAMLHFQSSACDAMVLEVGLGGRLDSTNVCEPLLCLITSISYDHMRQLGDTLALIAGEKAGIIKAKIPVITGVREAEPLEVIKRVAASKQAPLQQIGVDFDYLYHAPDSDHGDQPPSMDYARLRDGVRQLVAEDLSLGAIGEHQAANASLAWAACETLRTRGMEIPDDAIRRGLGAVRCPGRIEIVRRDPTVVIDTAHNGASIQALVRVLQESFPERPRVLILAATQGKAVGEMLRRLLAEFETIICTQYVKNPRALPAADLFERARQVAQEQALDPNLLLADSPSAAWEMVPMRDDPSLVCATGSFFLAAEMKQILER